MEKSKVAEASTAVSPSSSQELEKPAPNSVTGTSNTGSSSTDNSTDTTVSTNTNSVLETTSTSDSENNTADEAADDADESDLMSDEEREIGQVVDAATTSEPASKDGKWVNVKDTKTSAATSN